MKTDQTETAEENQIREQIDQFVNAFKAKDVETMMMLFAPEMISFDIIPPLEYAGSKVYRQVWLEAFALFEDSIDIELKNVHITSGNDVAFGHFLIRLHATKNSGKKIDYWQRLTFCFRKINEKWLITHEHVSLPVDLKTGKAMMDLKPVPTQFRQPLH